VRDNLFDRLECVAADAQGPCSWSPRSLSRPHYRYDLKLVAQVDSWRDDGRAAEALERIAREPYVEDLLPDGDEVWVRLGDDWVQRRGRSVEEGVSLASHSDLAAGQRFAIYFWCANATKALHIGHLRNLAIGNGLTGALREMGAEVQRRSLICDWGRSMGEAMAGIALSGPQAEPECEKSDHFVGRCYLDYLQSSPARKVVDVGAGEISAIGSSAGHDDGADDLIRRLMCGEPKARELWSRTRRWVIDGQLETLRRLGIDFERVIFESDFVSYMDELERLGLENGLLRRDSDGVIRYETGHPELAEMPLVRGDGVPTQHMRALAYWMAAPELNDLTSMQVSGSEWVAHVSCRRKLMGELTGDSPARTMHPTFDVFHGMVSVEQRAMSSSTEGALLVDDLVDWLDAQIDSDRNAEQVRSRHPHPERVASQTALAFFVLHPVGKAIEFDPAALLDTDRSLGWALARARADRSPAQKAGMADDHASAEYRFAVVQSEVYRRHLRRTLETMNIERLARYTYRLASWYVEQPRGRGVERLVQAVLEQASRGLGLEPAI
jgi:arginyl-tRNA synthetase